MRLLHAMKLLTTVESVKYKTMPSYCLKCKKNKENINSRVSKTSNGKIMLLSKCAICGRKKSRFIKKQEASGILSSLSHYWVISCFECSYKYEWNSKQDFISWR